RLRFLGEPASGGEDPVKDLAANEEIGPLLGALLSGFRICRGFLPCQVLSLALLSPCRRKTPIRQASSYPQKPKVTIPAARSAGGRRAVGCVAGPSLRRRTRPCRISPP